MTKKIIAIAALMTVLGDAAFAEVISNLEDWIRKPLNAMKGKISAENISSFGLMATDDTNGLTIGIDGFSFGNVAGKKYEFTGKNGQGSIEPKIRFDMKTGKLALTGQTGVLLPFVEEGKPTIGFGVEAGYAISEALNTGAYFKAAIPTEEESNPLFEIVPRITLTKDFAFGSVYGKLDLGLTIVDKFISIGTGTEDHITIGLKTKTGISAFVRPHLTFVQLYDGESLYDVDFISQFDIGAGYAKGPLDISFTVGIPAVEDGIKNSGLSIEPCITFAIKPNIKIYLDVLFDSVGSDVGVFPTIGGTFSL
jgi:hypothetical protein